MRKALFVVVAAWIFFLAEYIFFNAVSEWCRPNFLLLLVMFSTLAFGIRYGLFAAFVAGFLKDSFGAGIFGIYILSFFVCAYVTVFVRRHMYYEGHDTFSRALLALCVSVVMIGVHFTLMNIFYRVAFLDMLRFILIPEVALTVVSAPYIFKQCKQCASRLFV